jgi:hypothetical protein
MHASLISALAVLAAATAPPPPPAPEVTSVYTEISEKTCILLPASDEPGDEDSLRCQGPGGFELLALSGDLRATVTLIDPDGKELPLEFWEVITGHFSHLGPRAEWRVREAVCTPQALIVRMFAFENPEDSSDKTSYLAVAKITPEATCVTDRIEAGADDNVRARAAADTAASRPCLAMPQP